MKASNAPSAAGSLGGAALCRFGAKPSNELLAYAREHFDDQFGAFVVESLKAFFSNNRILEGAEELFTVTGS